MNNSENIHHSSQPVADRLLAQIDELPNQLQLAWEQGKRHPLPAWTGIRQVILCGIGGSGVAGELLQAYAASSSLVSMAVWRDYSLPAWAIGPETLVVILSHRGDEEEMLSALGSAVERRCCCLAIGGGGTLARRAREAGVACWLYPDEGLLYEPPAWMFGLTAAALYRLGLLADIGVEIHSAVEAMRQQQSALKAEVPPSGNPARRMAGQMMGRWVTIVGSGVLAPVARHWQYQIARLAKTWAQVEFLPEMDHTLLGSVLQPDGMLPATMIVFLRGMANPSRDRLQGNLTKQAFMLEGLGTDFVDILGDTPLAMLWAGVHYGDYTAYYLALAYGIDPAPSPAIDQLKRELAASE